MAMATASKQGRNEHQEQAGKDDIDARFSSQADLGHMAAVQRNGGKLADVLDRAAPRKAVVHIGNHAHIHTVLARLVQNILHNSAFAGSGKEDLIHKLLAGVLEERIEGSHHVTRGDGKTGAGAGKVDKALEGVAETADALQMMAERMRLRPGADDEHVAGSHATVEAPVNQEAVNHAAQAERDGDQAHRDEHNAAGNILGVNQVEGTGEEQAGDKAGLRAQPLLMEKAGQAGGSIQMQTPADDDQREGESAQKGQQDPHGAAMNERAAPQTPCALDRPGMEDVERGQRSRPQDGEDIQDHPQPGHVPGVAHGVCFRPF